MRRHLVATSIIAAVAANAAGANPAVTAATVTEQGSTSMDRPATPAPSQAGFDLWLDGFRARAAARGISPTTLAAALDGIAYNPAVVERDRNQLEFTKAIWDYLDKAVSDDRIAAGRAALDRHRNLFDRIEATYGVEREVVAAIWGLESAYGAVRGDVPLFEALATLAYDGRRSAFFEAELVALLTILQSGEARAGDMRGSWAGAMGHTQFMPTSFLRHAVDFDGDGRRDIWSDDPADALASTAAYLSGFGWVKGQRWGVEVTVPAGFDYALGGERVKKPAAAWAGLGIRNAAGGAVAGNDPASILMPAGARGAAFMIFENFHVLERYNTADAYVIAVGHLADRLRGGPPIRSGWPREDRVLTLAERIELQERLTAAGFDTIGVDGKIGPNTIAAVRAFQRAHGLVPDGYASLDILGRLR